MILTVIAILRDVNTVASASRDLAPARAVAPDIVRPSPLVRP